LRLGLETEVLMYAQIGALLGGETATQGAPVNPGSDNALIRSIDNDAFNSRIGPPWVDAIGDFIDPELAEFVSALEAGAYDAWMIHLAEGVRDEDRRPGDAFSSRAEFETLRAKGLLTDTTVIIHGTALEPADFAAMRAAPSVRTDGVTDGRGAKLVWSTVESRAIRQYPAGEGMALQDLGMAASYSDADDGAVRLIGRRLYSRAP
jgi:5-methylthioadenosine/S-adenosylhomocysteine deaminase